jgi:hypothetical protein
VEIAPGKRPPWILRLNKAGDGFTIEVFIKVQGKPEQGKARRIQINEKGNYFVVTEAKDHAAKPREYENLVNLVEHEVPEFHKILGMRQPDTIPQSLEHWESVVSGKKVVGHTGGNYDVLLSSGTDTAREVYLDTAMVYDRLRRIENKLAKLTELVAAKAV